MISDKIVLHIIRVIGKSGALKRNRLTRSTYLSSKNSFSSSIFPHVISISHIPVTSMANETFT